MKGRFLHEKFFSGILISGLILILASGCGSRKKTILFRNMVKDTVNVLSPPEYLVQMGDVLYLRVQSMDEKASAFITGDPSIPSSNTGYQISEQSLYYNGYEVGPNGTIHLPYIDSLFVIGMTTDQIADMVTDSLAPFIKETLISVKLGSFRVCVLGEVQTPGTYLFYHRHVSIFDVIALAKPTEFYNATNVVITRQIKDKRIQIERIDLTSPQILSSPFYYLQPNDQIYIEPLKVKKYGFSTFPYALLLSTISTIMLIYSIIK
jgi:polysaccharide export outer membrane protein